MTSHQSKKILGKKILVKLKKLFPNARMMLRYSNNWELMVAVQLSAQCTDKKVNEVTKSPIDSLRTQVGMHPTPIL
jgi:endonuclease-3